MLTDANGSTNVVRYDYQPFGGELPASYGGRTAAMGYPTIMDTLDPRYTGKNRDSESSLDWFEIRSRSGPVPICRSGKRWHVAWESANVEYVCLRGEQSP